MDSENSGASKGKRGRKRDEQELELSEDEKKKRQKNRDAAKKCRMNKLKEVEDLKKNNKNLENQNRELLKKKSLLEDKVQQLVKLIQDHTAKGCQLSPEQKHLYFQKYQDFNEIMVSMNQINGCVSQSSSSDQTTVAKPNILVQPSSSATGGSPITLFTGQPLSPEQIQRRSSTVRRSSSQSSSSSKSPSPVSYQLGLTDVLVHSNGIPSSGPLAPIKTSQNGSAFSVKGLYKQEPVLDRQVSTDSSASSIPLVVQAFEEEGMKDTDQGLGLLSKGLQQAREEPAMDIEESASPLYTSSLSECMRNASADTGINNLKSGGFIVREENLSVTSHMPQTVTTQEAQKLSDGIVNISYSKLLLNKKSTDDVTQLNVTAPELIPRAILNIPDSQMSFSLKQQIHSNWSSSSQSHDSASQSRATNDVTEQEEQSAMEQTHECSHLVNCEPQNQLSTRNQQHVTEIQLSNQENKPAEQQSPNYSQAGPSQEQETSEFTGPIFKNIKYVEKKGHHFLLDELPNGKHRVYEIKPNNTLVDTGYEIRLKDSPANQSSENSPTKTPSPTQVENSDVSINHQFQQVQVNDPATTVFHTGTSSASVSHQIHNPENPSVAHYVEVHGSVIVSDDQNQHINNAVVSSSQFQDGKNPVYISSISNYPQVMEENASSSQEMKPVQAAQTQKANNLTNASQPQLIANHSGTSAFEAAKLPSQGVEETVSTGGGLTSVDLPSLTFNDFTQEGIDVYAKKPKAKKGS